MRSRKQARRSTRLPLEVSAPQVTGESGLPSYELMYPAGQVPLARWPGNLDQLLRQATTRMGISQEVAAAMGLSASAASRLLQRADPVMMMAIELAESLRPMSPRHEGEHMVKNSRPSPFRGQHR